jgi:valyl-tRNA synthetase
MEIAKTYDPKLVEDKWYKNWLDNGYFSSKPDDRDPYTIVIPPPNVTGMLHMGHILNNTIQDILVRRARLQGKNACWVPGMDHASIATEAKVVDMLADQGIDKASLSRDDFLKHAWEWKEKYGGIILKQLQKLGASCDWDRTTFTMDDDYYKSVIKVFVDLHNKGLIYRGVRMINWDPEAQTALSNEEVNYKEVASKLYYVNYKIVGEEGHVTVATTRPETILGDTAICFNPNDERFKGLAGKQVIVPVAEREIPLIEDEYVDMEFGTGALKITPAHDVNDYEIGQKHGLASIDIFNPDGTLSEAAGHFVGEDRFAVRKKMAEALESNGALEKVEEYANKVGYSERTNAVIEPRISIQWFCKMKELAQPALEHVMDDTIKFHPSNQKNTYRHWMENIQDWCISRQLWWGQRIPAWYLPDDSIVVAIDEDEALTKAREASGNNDLQPSDLRQDEDVLDTWFSSWIWPIEVFKGFSDPDNEEINYYNPTSTLVTAPDIIFFWVARMAMSNYEYMDRPPFDDVYFTGLVRDKEGRKMSKSLGNSPDPLDLMDQYGTDAVRFGILIASPAGNDLLFDDKMCEQGRNFCNKIWNAMRLVDQWTPGEGADDHSFAIDWFKDRLASTVAEIDELLAEFHISEALKKVYSLIWDDFCSWYLEMVKPGPDKVLKKETYDQTILFFEELMTVLHPFMPFVSEETFHLLSGRSEDETVMFHAWPVGKADTPAHPFQEVVSNVRQIRAESNIAPREELELFIKAAKQDAYASAFPVIEKLANLSKLDFTESAIPDAKGFLIGTDEFFVPVAIDMESERQKLEKDLEYQQGFLASVNAKLANPNFVEKAPEALVNKEKQKLSDAQEKIRIIEENLAKLT